MHSELLIRSDASPQIGTGHLMRCLALAEQWIFSGGTATLASAGMPLALVQRAQTMGLRFVQINSAPGSSADAQETCCLSKQQNAHWLLVDGYHFDAAYQQTVKSDGVRCLWIDDFGHAREYCADLVLNQNLDASQELYPKISSSTRLLLGCRFAILRREFLKWQDWQRSFPPAAGRILITLGGSDYDNVTLKVIEALKLLGGGAPRASILIGASCPHRATLEKALVNTPHQLLCNITHMAELMAEADLAIGAGGTTTWEFACLGLPALMFILAENQVPNCTGMARLGAAVNLGWHHAVDPQSLAAAISALAQDESRRRKMSAAARNLVDGNGSLRVWLNMQETALTLRPAELNDCRRVWEWANEPAVRAVSFSSEAIPWETHVPWFNKQIASENRCFWLLEFESGNPAGQVRFEMEAACATISISLAPACRGRNLGTLAIWAAARKFFRENPRAEKILAFIKPGNDASVSAFKKAGFEKAPDSMVKGQPALCYELTRRRAEL